MSFQRIQSQDIEQSLLQASRQYLLGSPTQWQPLAPIPDAAVAVEISSHAAAACEPARRYAQARELQYVLSGMTECLDLQTGEVHRFVKGDFFAIEPGTAYVQRMKLETRILLIRHPGGEKSMQPELSEAQQAWAQAPLRATRLDYTSAAEAPPPNSLKPAVTIAVLNDRSELLLIKRRDSGTWAMPGGTLEFAESLEDCARREIREETGLELGELRIVGTYTDPGTLIGYSDGEVRREFSVLLAGVAQSSALSLDDESTAGGWVPLDKALEYDMVPSQIRRVRDALRFFADGSTFLR